MCAESAEGHKHASARCGHVKSMLKTCCDDHALREGLKHAEFGEPMVTQTSCAIGSCLDVRGSVLRSGHDLAVLIMR